MQLDPTRDLLGVATAESCTNGAIIADLTEQATGQDSFLAFTNPSPKIHAKCGPATFKFVWSNFAEMVKNAEPKGLKGFRS